MKDLFAIEATMIYSKLAIYIFLFIAAFPLALYKHIARDFRKQEPDTCTWPECGNLSLVNKHLKSHSAPAYQSIPLRK